MYVDIVMAGCLMVHAFSYDGIHIFWETLGDYVSSLLTIAYLAVFLVGTALAYISI